LDAALAATWSDIVSRAEGRGLEAWSEQFADVAEYLSDEESAVFAPGVLAVARGARFRGAKGWTRGPMPFVAGALVAIPKSVAEGEAFVRELTGRVATGFGVEAPKWESADLGLGVPTHALRLDGLAAREFDGDFRPHWFFIGSRMVVSSDPQLSKELQRRAADEPTAKPPADLLCEWWRIEGPVLVDACTGLERWARAWPDHGEIPGIQMLGPACRMLAAACEHVERIERSSVVQERSLRDRWQLRLRAAK
jgi:hypothetical protein